MNCREWEERLALYAGGDLIGDEAAQVERHLTDCPGCQVFSSGLLEAREWLHQAHREPVATAHFAAVRARVLTGLERERRSFWRRWWVAGLTATAAAALVALAVWPQTTPPVAAPAAVMARIPAAPLVGPAPLPPPRKESPQHSVKAGEPVLIKVLSDNPDVVIYWIAETKGE